MNTGAFVYSGLEEEYRTLLTCLVLKSSSTEYVRPKRRCVNAATGENSKAYFTYAYLTEEILLYVKAVYYYSWHC